MTQAIKKHVSKYQESHHKNGALSPRWLVGTKGVWAEEKASGTYSLVDEEISLPAAVIKQGALTNNLDWMQAFADHHKVKLCPHGKTTMTPEFFSQQLEGGAWGITIASAPQAETAALAGAKNIIMANQLVGRANMAMVANLVEQQEIQFYCCVDSTANVDQLSAYFSERGITLDVLIEFGVPGGRCGCRTAQEAKDLAGYIKTKEGIALAGIEVYEGVIHGDNAEALVRQFIEQTLELAQSLKADSLITADQALVTGAGSAWYDVVAETLAGCDAGDEALLPVIRPGCYLIHDTGIYQDAQDAVMARATENRGYACDLGGDLQSSLEVWAYVVSRPEPSKAVIGLGKRDAAFDAGLPVAEHGYRQGKEIGVQGLVATAVMDQHTFVTVPEGLDLQVGDMVAFSTSHPCLTFDKWRYICVCDDNYVVERWVETCF